MASPQIIALLEQALALAKAAPAVEVEAAEPVVEADTKVSPLQKLEKKLEEENEKLEKLNAKIAGGKSKIPDKDAENKTKLEEKISELETKIDAEKEKEAKKAEKAATVKKVVAKKGAEKEPVAEKATKHVPRLTAAMTLQLKTAFESAEARWDDNFKKEILTYVNSLSDDDYRAMTFEGHCSTFASMQSDDDDGEETTQPRSGGGGSAAAVAAPLKILTVSELQKHDKAKNLEQVTAGVFKLIKTGETVTGPHEIEDGDYKEESVDGMIYMVCTKTKRVYKPTDGADEFVGFWGVGKW